MFRISVQTAGSGCIFNNNAIDETAKVGGEGIMPQCQRKIRERPSKSARNADEKNSNFVKLLNVVIFAICWSERRKWMGKGNTRGKMAVGRGPLERTHYGVVKNHSVRQELTLTGRQAAILRNICRTSPSPSNIGTETRSFTRHNRHKSK